MGFERGRAGGAMLGEGRGGGGCAFCRVRRGGFGGEDWVEGWEEGGLEKGNGGGEEDVVVGDVEG